jgi:predicted RNA-binding Zn-ribbon protein involved in translation (DUF1610 family)
MSDKSKTVQSTRVVLDDVQDGPADEGAEAVAQESFEEEGLDVQDGVASISADEDVPTVDQAVDPSMEPPTSQEEIRSTDILFNCPSCGSSLAIDYRGAGLQINCTQCGALAQVPIPSGMDVSDLDLSAGELLVQLFQTRSMMLKRDLQITELTQVIESLKARRGELERNRMNTLHRYAELAHMCQSISRTQAEMTGILSRMVALISEEQQL